jgi:hypothetical protein
MANKELIVAWLNDAHAMELGIAEVWRDTPRTLKITRKCIVGCNSISKRPGAMPISSKVASSGWGSNLPA